MARPKSGDEKPLTDTELHIMNTLWHLGTGTVHEVREELSKQHQKDYAYTTVSTMLRILEKKGAVSSEKEGRGHRYTPIIQQRKYQKRAAEHLVNNVFAGERTALLRNLLGHGKLSQQELEEIQQILAEKAKKQ